MKDLVGNKYCRLTVLSFERRVGSAYYWLCECECGNKKEVQASKLKSGRSKSCGCYRTEKTIERSSKHGQNKRLGATPEYRAWYNAKTRCFNPKHKHYSNYGGRGITMCKEWQQSFSSFFADMGTKPEPHLTLERKNSDGNYEPLNCKWATRSEQNKNRRRRKRT